MKNPHDKSEYEQMDRAPMQSEEKNSPEPANAPEAQNAKAPVQNKSKKSGAYYYVETDENKLSELAFIRTILTVIALMLQIVVLCLPQGSLEYVTLTYPSFAFCYMLAVFVFIGIAIWFIIMNATRYKFLKRIPKEHAPKNGFKNRAFFGNELYIAINAAILVFEISFLCFKYDGIGLVGMFLCALALAAAVAARQVTHYALKTSTLIPASEADDAVAEDADADVN